MDTTVIHSKKSDMADIQADEATVLLNQARSMIEQMQRKLRGNPQIENHRLYGIPCLEPLTLPEPIHIIHQDPVKMNIDLLMTKVKLYRFIEINFTALRGVRNGELKKTFTVLAKFEHLPIKFRYKMHFMALPYNQFTVFSEDEAAFDYTNVRVEMTYDIEEYHNTTTGRKHIRISRLVADFDTSGCTTRFSGAWGNEISHYFNANWGDMLVILKTQIAAAIGAAFLPIFNNIADKLPYDEFFHT